MPVQDYLDAQVALPGRNERLLSEIRQSYDAAFSASGYDLTTLNDTAGRTAFSNVMNASLEGIVGPAVTAMTGRSAPIMNAAFMGGYFGFMEADVINWVDQAQSNATFESFSQNYMSNRNPAWGRAVQARSAEVIDALNNVTIPELMAYVNGGPAGVLVDPARTDVTGIINPVKAEMINMFDQSGSIAPNWLDAQPWYT